MTKDNIGADLVKQTPMMVSQADSSPSAALTATNKQTQQSNQEQVELNKSVGGRRRKKRRKRQVQHGGAADGITIPQAPATGGSSKDANAGIAKNFTAITQAGSNSQYDDPPKVGGRRKTRRKRRTGRKRRRKKTKSRKKRRHKTKKKRRRKRKNTKKNRK